MNFHDMYTSYYSRAFKFVKSYVADKDAAEDIVAESMATLWSRFDPSRDATAIQFLFTILKNKSLDYLRSQKNRMMDLSGMEQWELEELELRISSLNNASETTILSDEINKIASSTIAGMPKRTRDIFKRNRIEGKSYLDISKEFDISTKGVEYHMSLALKLLRAALKDYLPSI